MKASIFVMAAVQAGPIYPAKPHWNEDPTSRPEVLSGKKYLTSTQAKYISQNYTGHIKAMEPEGPEQYWLRPYNVDDQEYVSLNMGQESSSSSSSSSESDDEDALVMWRVTPDYGELDHTVLPREQELPNGEKESGWTNPLSWSDTGDDDDQVVTQLNDQINYIGAGLE